jgi:hypothetical protein
MKKERESGRAGERESGRVKEKDEGRMKEEGLILSLSRCPALPLLLHPSSFIFHPSSFILHPFLPLSTIFSLSDSES